MQEQNASRLIFLSFWQLGTFTIFVIYALYSLLLLFKKLCPVYRISNFANNLYFNRLICFITHIL